MNWYYLLSLTTAFFILTSIFLLIKLLKLQKESSETKLDLINQLNESHNVDPLTGVLNRPHFFKHGEQEFDRVRRYGEHLTLVRVEIDQVDQIIEKFGPKAGDLVFQSFCQTASRITRSLDIIGRLDHKEFALLLPNTPTTDALKLAERLRLMSEQLELNFNGNSFSFTISGGIAVYQREEDTLPGSIQIAEKNLAEAVRLGGNKIINTNEDS